MGGAVGAPTIPPVMGFGIPVTSALFVSSEITLGNDEMARSSASFFSACVDDDDDDELFVPCEPEPIAGTADNDLCECKLVDADVWEIPLTIPFAFAGIHFFELQISSDVILTESSSNPTLNTPFEITRSTGWLGCVWSVTTRLYFAYAVFSSETAIAFRSDDCGSWGPWCMCA